jgi:hypothetical protein
MGTSDLLSAGNDALREFVEQLQSRVVELQERIVEVERTIGRSCRSALGFGPTVVPSGEGPADVKPVGLTGLAPLADSAWSTA